MAAISNKTQRPVSVPLPDGKTLHLSPGKTGQVSAKAVETPQFRKLVDAGQIEVVDEKAQPTAGPGGSKKGRAFVTGHSSAGTIRRSGNR